MRTIFVTSVLLSLSISVVVFHPRARASDLESKSTWRGTTSAVDSNPHCMDNLDALDLAGSSSRGPQSTSSLIVRFYRDGVKDTLGRTLAEMQEYSDYEMERCHDHMQWMFPLHEPSMFATEFEILTGDWVKRVNSRKTFTCMGRWML